ncbi:DsbA family protein [Actinoplanes sp. LDG1-06]|uniref:2-hydroxychromene-2-carboxylate isomerase n=1 Tax=Paractinoplanes ovalisporus TaxID=2810368 RepID=A0ABS2AI76_9ACTN|nr:DsbA family protein [Actinoplanes ovalisporus]MBM2619531.1 DsbA family protein [Actinoplanes ovalisporus]
MARKPARWYFSFRSPYSWFAYRDLITAHPEVADAITWIPFWEPDEHSERHLSQAGVEFPYTPMGRDKHFYILQDTRRLAESRALSMVWPVDRQPHWEVAHLGWIAARTYGLEREFADAVFEARWEHGADICDVTVVEELGVRAGLPLGTVKAALDDPAIREEAGRALVSSAKDGVFGVPFFIVGRHKFWGVDRLPLFAEAWRASQPDRVTIPPVVTLPAAELPVLATADAGHAGGCG